MDTIQTNVRVRINGIMRNIDEGEWFRFMKNSRLQRANNPKQTRSRVLEPIIEENLVDEVTEEEVDIEIDDVILDDIDEDEDLDFRLTPFVEFILQRDLDRIIRAYTQPRIEILDYTQFNDFNFQFVVHGAYEEIYSIIIKRIPLCTCPDRIYRGVACKHIIHVLLFFFNLDVDNYLLYQRSYTFRELAQLFQN